METINLVTPASEVDVSTLVRLWHLASKFQNHIVNFHVGFKESDVEYYKESLRFKLNWCNKKYNHHLTLCEHTRSEIENYYKGTVSDENFNPAFIQYLKETQNLDYIVFVDENVLISQQQTPELWKEIEQQTNWYIEGSSMYGKKLKEEQDWTSILGRSIFETDEEMELAKPTVCTFDEKTICGSYYKSWMLSLKSQYYNGSNLFSQERF